MFQFYRCFLILFHCRHQLTELGPSSMPSKTTAVQLNRRVMDGGPAQSPSNKPFVDDPEGTSAAVSDKIAPAEPPLHELSSC